MKKLTTIAFMFISATLFFTACKKEKNLSQEYNSSGNISPQSSGSSDSITINSCGVMNFKNIEVFENTNKEINQILTTNYTDSTPIITWLNSRGFNSFTTTNLKSSLGEGEIADSAYNKVSEVVAGLLTSDGIIQIDSMAFLLDYENGFIYEMYPVTCTNISLLLNKEEILDDTNMYIFKYSTELDLFHYDYLDTTATLHLKKGAGKFFKKVWNYVIGNGSGGGLFCDEQHAPSIPYEAQKPYCHLTSSRYAYSNLQTKYLTMGVLFETKIEFSHRLIGGWTSWQLWPVKYAIKYTETHQVRCGTTGSDFFTDTYYNNPSSWSWGAQNPFIRKPYSSSKALKKDANSMSAEVKFKRHNCDTSLVETLIRPYFTF